MCFHSKQSQFYESYKNFSQDRLFQIVLEESNYQPDAVLAAKEIIEEKNWKNDLNIKLEENREKKIIEKKLLQEKIKKKAEYYKNLVDFKNSNNPFHIKIADIPKFESALIKNDIEFFSENKNMGFVFNSYPTKVYYFKDEDVEQVDKLTKKLKLACAPIYDIKNIFMFELRVVLFVVILTVLFLILR